MQEQQEKAKQEEDTTNIIDKETTNEQVENTTNIIVNETTNEVKEDTKQAKRII